MLFEAELYLWGQGWVYSQKLQNEEMDPLVLCSLSFEPHIERLGMKTNVRFMHLWFLPLFGNCKRMNIYCRFWWSLSVAARPQDLNYCRKFIVWALHANRDGAVRDHFDTSTESSHVYSQKYQNCEMSVMMMEFSLFIMLHMFVMGGLKTIELPLMHIWGYSP